MTQYSPEISSRVVVVEMPISSSSRFFPPANGAPVTLGGKDCVGVLDCQPEPLQPTFLLQQPMVRRVFSPLLSRLLFARLRVFAHICSDGLPLFGGTLRTLLTVVYRPPGYHL